MSARSGELLVVAAAADDEVSVLGLGKVKVVGLTVEVTGGGNLVIPHVLSLVIGHAFTRPCRRVAVNGLLAISRGILIIHIAVERCLPVLSLAGLLVEPDVDVGAGVLLLLVAVGEGLGVALRACRRKSEVDGIAVVVVGTDLDGGAVGEGYGSGIVEAVCTLNRVLEGELNGEGLALEGAVLNRAGRSGRGFALIDDRNACRADVAREGAARYGEGAACYGIGIGAVRKTCACDFNGGRVALDVGENDTLAASLYIGNAARVADRLGLAHKEVVELVDFGNRCALVGGVGACLAHQSGAGTDEIERGRIFSGADHCP